MFYELDSIDAFATNPWKRSTNGDLSGTFAGQLDMFAEITRQFDPHTEFRDKEIDDSTTGTSTLASSVLPEDRIADIELPDLQVPNVLPDGYGRVFHPQVLLHQIISNLVVWNINNVRHAQAGQLQFPQDLKLDSCPTGPGQDVPLDDTPHCDHDLDNIESDLFRK
jgi:hypothetical protein